MIEQLYKVGQKMGGLCWEFKEPKGPKGRIPSTGGKGEVFAYVGRNQNLKDLKARKAYAEKLDPRDRRSFTAIRKDAGLCCGSRLRSGEVFAYVGRNQNLKDLKHPCEITA